MEHATNLSPSHSIPPTDMQQIEKTVFEPVFMDYAFLRSCSTAMNEKRDCAVIALAVVTGRTYTDMHERLRKAGRRTRCGTPWGVQRKVLDELGLTAHDITGYYDGSSIRSIAPQLPQQGKFLVRTHKHIAAVREGVVEDWSEMRKLYVQGIYKILEADEPYPLPEKRRRNIVINYEKATKAVHIIADLLFDEELEPATTSRKWWSTFRAKVSAECQANGINKTTAAVQTGKWMADNGYHMGFMV